MAAPLSLSRRGIGDCGLALGRVHRLHGSREVDRRPQRRRGAGDDGDRRRPRDRAATRQADRRRVRAGRRGGVSRGGGADHAGAARHRRGAVARGRRDRSRRASAAALADHLVVWLDVPFEVAWERCRGSGRPLARDRDQFERLYAEREPIYAELADAIVPSERSTAMGQVLAALEGMPAGVKLLWGTSASGDYPAYIGPGLLDPHRFWPATVAGTPVPGDRRQCRPALRRDAGAAVRTGGDHARRAVQDGRPRGDRVDRARPRRDDAYRRGGRARRRASSAISPDSARRPTSAECATSRCRPRCWRRSTRPTAARPASTWPRPRTTSAPITSRRP